MNTSRVAVYDISYINKLKACLAVFVVLSFASIAAGIFSWNVEHNAHIPIRAELTALQAENANLYIKMAALQKYKDEKESRIARAQAYIRKINPSVLPVQAKKIAEIEDKYSDAYGVPLYIGLAVTKTESSFNVNARSRTGPTGLKQVAISHWKSYFKTHESSFLDVDKNVGFGYHILKKHYIEQGTYFSALKRYYGGSEKENVDYARKVMYTAYQIKQQGV